MICANNSYAKNYKDPTLVKPKNDSGVSVYVLSESFSNILPIKQLVEDDWQQMPASDSSAGFTQNEIGLKTYWHNFSLNLAHRLDYFVYTNADTATAFYLERTDQPLTSQNSYQLALKLHHQRSKGFRLGYFWQFDNFSTELNLGYWEVSDTRESKINGEIFGDQQNNITGTAQLNEFYSHKNFLKRDNYDRWDINGYGITLDFAAHWSVNDKLDINLMIKDLHSQFKMKNLGHSSGNIDTDGTFINSLGGKSYLPLYRGKETSDDYRFSLPEHINLIANYNGGTFRKIPVTLSYLARYKRQGDVNFYYGGIALTLQKHILKLMVDLEHLSPEIHYDNQWFNLALAMDDSNLDKAMQLSLGVSVNYSF